MTTLQCLSEKHYEVILRSIGDAVVATDAQGRIELLNPVAEALTGWRQEEARGKPLDEVFRIVDEETRQTVESPVARVLSEGQVVGLANHSLLIARDGTEWPIADSGAPIRDESGATTGVVLVFRDRTKERAAQRALEEAASRSVWELAVRNRIAQIFLTVSDEEMYAEILAVILEITGSRHGVFGYLDEKGDLVVPTMTRTIWDKCQVPDKRFVFPRASWGDSSWPTAIREKRTILHNEPSTRTPEGHIRISRHISMPLTHRGRVMGLIQVANKEQDYTAVDITMLEAIGSVIAPVLEARLARERQEDRLQEALRDLLRSNKELEQFAYVASHDLQEPLRMVSSYTQLLARRYGDRLDQDAMEFIGFAVDGANRMQQLIQDLLVYSRVTTRGSPFVPLDLCEALGEAVANLQAAINESAAMVTHGELPTVNADRRQMVQVLQNLVGNSIKFRRKDEPPRVHVSAERADDEWIISVKDNGIGINPEYFNRIFVIFQRLHGKTEYPGTGIGLALCRQIVTRHGGRIWVESSPGEGATFHFTIKA